MPNPKEIHILFASRLVLEKWVDILIEAIEKIALHDTLRDQVSWTITSDGLYEEEIRELTRIYPSVQYLGKISPQELASLYRESDFLFMPSRFLETFGLTALESLACGVPVIGFQKGWLASLIPDELALDAKNPVISLLSMLEKYSTQDLPLIDVSLYNYNSWRASLDTLFASERKILLVHDYRDRIGWAEYYVESVSHALISLGREVACFSYPGKTTPWKRRIMFIFSVFAFWRGTRLSHVLEKTHPDAIWMHSILRYVWPWGVSAVAKYVKKNPSTHVYLSHHDVGLIAPFPQDITLEREIPGNPCLWSFLRGLSFTKASVAWFKWWYICLIRYLLPRGTEHIVFSPFLASHIRAHFPEAKVRVFPHSYDENIFHP